MKHLLFAAEIFLNTPSGEICFGNFYDVFFGTDFLIGSKHHRMISDVINQYKINIFLESCYLHLYMGKVGIALFPSVDKGRFDLAFPLVSESGCMNPFAVKIEFSFCSKADDIILLKFIKFKEHLVVIVALVKSKGGFAKECSPLFHGSEGNIIEGSKVFFREE